MRAPTLLLVLLSAACQQHGTSTPAAPPEAAAPQAGAGAKPAAALLWTAAQQACVDRWLSTHALDAYGSPQGKMYAGGTPLFDEATGQHTSRQDFLAQHQPEALRSCGL
ncbi:MAG: hypothetical protein ACLQDQ_06520 [Myxococcaceae bacterium]